MQEKDKTSASNKKKENKIAFDNIKNSSLNKSISVLSNTKNLSNLPLMESSNLENDKNLNYKYKKNFIENKYLQSFTYNITEGFDSPQIKEKFEFNRLSVSPLNDDRKNHNKNSINNILSSTGNETITHYVSSFKGKNELSRKADFEGKNDKKNSVNISDTFSINFNEKIKDFNNLSFESKVSKNKNAVLEDKNTLKASSNKNNDNDNDIEIKNSNNYKSNLNKLNTDNNSSNHIKNPLPNYNNLNNETKSFKTNKDLNLNFNSNDFLIANQKNQTTKQTKLDPEQTEKETFSKYKKEDESNQKSTSRTAFTKRSFAESDNLLALKARFECEREERAQILVQTRVLKLKNTKERTISKNLLGFSETRIKHIMNMIDFFILFLVISDISLSAYTNTRFTSAEYDRNQRIVKDEFTADRDINNLRISIISIILLIYILLLFKYYYKLKLYRLRSLASVKDGIFSSGLYQKLFAEMLLLLPFTPPEANELIQGNLVFGSFTYSLDSIILLLKLIKLYYVFVVLSGISPWLSDKTKDFARSAKSSIGFLFAFKAALRNNPIILIISFFIFFVLIFGFTAKTFEFGFIQEAEKIRVNKNLITGRPNSNSSFGFSKVDNSFFASYWDVFWLIAMTMTTVGFGDIYPETHLGRFVCFFAGVIGLVMVSLVVVRFGMLLELGENEKKVFLAIKAKENMNEIDGKAKELVKALFKLRLVQRKKREGQFTSADKLSTFFLQLMITKQKVRAFYHIKKKHEADSIFLEDIIASLSYKVQKDSSTLGYNKYAGSDMNYLVNAINTSHLQIHKSLDLLKAKNNNISKFLINLNKHLFQKKMERK